MRHSGLDGAQGMVLGPEDSQRLARFARGEEGVRGQPDEQGGLAQIMQCARAAFQGEIQIITGYGGQLAAASATRIPSIAAETMPPA